MKKVVLKYKENSIRRYLETVGSEVLQRGTERMSTSRGEGAEFFFRRRENEYVPLGVFFCDQGSLRRFLRPSGESQT